jgi:L-glutamine:2-deoxy-scyllo-inosose/3-amino-2,3-dideoxy-scyllo-inosose aminotransferase
MKSQLAIKGGPKAITEKAIENFPTWPVLNETTAERLKEVYLSGQWSFNGPEEQAFCQEFAEFCNAEYGVMMVNGTVTLETALHALGIGEGDEVIVPALTWMATAMVAVYNNATPVFVDIEPDTLCIDPVKIEAAITDKTKAIIPVHLYGSMADMEKIMELAKKYNLKVIEDCAHAHGGIWDGKGIGTIGHVGSFSFQQSKTMTSGEAGICLTNDSETAEKLYRIKHIGYAPNIKQGKADNTPPMGLLCHNYRATEFQAVILRDNLKSLQAQTELREKNAKRIINELAGVPGIEFQSAGRLATRQGFYGFCMLLKPEELNNISRDEFAEALRAEGLGFNYSYGPVYKHALWNVHPGKFRVEPCHVCEEICDKKVIVFDQIWLLGDDKLIDAMIEAIKKVAIAFAENMEKTPVSKY